MQAHSADASASLLLAPGSLLPGQAGAHSRETLLADRLRKTESLLQLAAQIGRLGAWSYEVGQTRVVWSEEVCAIHEVAGGFMPTPDEVVAFFMPPWRELLRRTLRTCLTEGTPFDVEAQLVTARGREVWMRVIGEAEWDDLGRVCRIQGACQDISDTRRAAEDKRLMAEQLTTALESLTDAFYTVDRDWRITFANAQAERLTRRPRSVLIGKTLNEAYPGLANTTVVSNLQRALEENRTVEFDEHYAPFGVWVRIKAYPSAQGLAVYVRDVTERVDTAREILRLNEELEQRVAERTAQLEAANKELEAFAYSIAHDLRAPLSSIDGFSRMLGEREGQSLAGRSRHFLERIRGGVAQMAQQTDGLLALASLSRASLRIEAVDLAVLAQAAFDDCRESSPAREVQVDIAAGLTVQGDARLLSQAMVNLIGNAWKFTSRTAGARIEVGMQDGAGGAPVFFVRDNGAGFDMAYASRMFEAFRRMHTPAEFEGTGIGLAIVHKVVTRHGGRIWAEAAPGRGASFFFTLGAVAAAA